MCRNNQLKHKGMLVKRGVFYCVRVCVRTFQTLNEQLQGACLQDSVVNLKHSLQIHNIVL